MLTVQYRMHERIMDWSSKELYNSKVLRACLDVVLLCRIIQITSCELLPWLGKEKKKSLDLIVIHALISLQVKAHPSVAAHMLLDLEDVKKTSSTEPTLLLIDIAGYALHCCLCIVAFYIKCCVL